MHFASSVPAAAEDSPQRRGARGGHAENSSAWLGALCASALRTLLFAALVLLPQPAAAGDPNFGAFVKQLEREYQLRRTHIPLFWLVKGIVRVASPAGVSRLDLAVFEDQDLRPLARDANLAGRLQSFLGPGWMPFVEAHSPKIGEHALMYVRQKGHDVEMMIFSIEPHEAAAVLTRINPDRLAEAINDPHSFLNRHN